jgi:cellulose synthase/poly-beta-1,6-N-acetylglucosamine synthase-like glycosyltransferase
MVGPLGDESVGASTGYRWFVSDPPSFGSEMRSVWNASIASALGPDAKTNFCWGGSMALRRETFEELDIRSKWKGTLSDDFVVTRAIREANLSIHFIPRAISPSVGDSSLLETIEFTNRQMKITRVYSPDLWLRSLIGSFVFNFVMVTALLIVIFSSQYGLNVVFAVATLTLVSLFSVGKAHYRFAAVKLVLADRRPAVKRQLLAQYTLWLLTPALFLTNCVAASLSRRVAWRGIRYELKSPTETVIIND